MASAFGGGGGEEGFRHMLNHLGPGIQHWLADMRTHAFDWSSESLDTIAKSLQDELKNHPSKQVEEARDKLTIDLVKLKSENPVLS